MRRFWIALAATALLAACSSDDTAGTAGAANGRAGGYGNTGVGSSSLNGPGGSGTGMLAPGVPDRVLFATDRSQLAPEARGTLDLQSGWLRQNARIAVQIAGNADERGTEEYNLALGQRRANAARDYLVSKGVQGSRISTISYGKDRPTALGSSPSDWAQNRNAITSAQH
jgi:peptidoglycan-associated lipoprotein